MLTTLLRAGAISACLLVPITASAADDGASLAAGISPAVADVVSGGSWSADKQGGFYRGLLIMVPGEGGFSAQLFLQWLSLPADNSMPVVVKTVPVKEVNDLKLQFASLEMSGEESKDNEVNIVVSSYNVEEDKDISLFIKATAPGTYVMTKAPTRAPSAPPEEAAPAAKTNVPKDD